MKIAAACLLLVASTAHAEDGAPPVVAPDGEKTLDSTAVDTRAGDEQTDGRRYMLAAIETVAAFGLAATLYYATPEQQKQDWVLHWDSESWNKKLTSLDAVRFDANPFNVNVFGHSTQAVLAYHAGRGNGFGLEKSALLNVAYSILWEYFVEFRENPSINDMIVNSVSAPALGEPLWQVGDYFRSGQKTTANEMLATLFQPFDEIERRVTGRKWRESARPWHRFHVGAGTSAQATRTDAAIDVDLEVVSFDRSGIRNGWTPAGGWSRITGGVRFSGEGFGGAHLDSRTSYAGYQSRAVYDNHIGHSWFLGFGTGISYESSDLGMETDQIATYHLIGPQADLHVRSANVDVRLQGAVYGDLGLVHAFALGAMPALDPEPPFESTLTGYGYYFGVGTTLWSRLMVEWKGWHADIEGRAHQLFSLDKRNSDRGEPDPPKDLADGRVFGKLTLGYAVLPNVLVDGVVDLAGRRGTAGDVERTDLEQRYGLMLTLQH